MLTALFMLIIVAVATYALLRVLQRHGTQPPLVTSRRSGRPSGPIGPDDDDDFLRELDRKRFRPEDPDS